MGRQCNVCELLTLRVEEEINHHITGMLNACYCQIMALLLFIEYLLHIRWAKDVVLGCTFPVVQDVHLWNSATRWRPNPDYQWLLCIPEWLYKSCWSDTKKEGAHQSTVDGDSLFGSITCRSSSLQPLRTGQVHKVKLGCQRLVLVHLGVSIGNSIISLSFLLNDNVMHKYKLVSQHCDIP